MPRPTALGDGQQDDYDDWSKATLEFIKGTDAKVAEIGFTAKELNDARATTSKK